MPTTTEVRRTVCNRDCPDACGLVATVEDGRVVKLGGDRDHPVTRGFLCYRTNHFLATQYSPERLTTPLLRDRASGELRPVDWDTALDVAAERLTTIRRESGPAAIFHYRSGGTLGLLGYVTDHFFGLFGPVTTKRGDICSGAGDAAQLTDFGELDSHDLFDLHNARSIVLWGKNVYVSSPHTIPVLRAARARGATLALIDPVRHRTAELCDAYYQPRPGGDFALAMAVAAALFARGQVDPRAGEYCDHLEQFRAMALSRPLAAWCQLADVDEGAALDVARRLWECRPAAILVGWGMGRRANGAGIVRALDALAAITGNLGVPGGGVSFYFKRRGAYDTSWVRGGQAHAPRTVCEPLFGSEVLAMRDPPIRAVWVTAGNPVAMLPDSRTSEEALRTREFVVVADAFLTDTARLAHLVLPTPTLLEADDLLGAYGHHWLGVSRPVVPPPPGVKSDLEIAQELSQRVGLGDAFAGTAREWKQRFVGRKLADKGVTLETLEAGPVRNPLAPTLLFTEKRFGTESGRVNLITAPPPDPLAEPDAEYPLVLMSVSTDRSQASQWAGAHPPEGPADVTVHPAAAMGLPDGALAVLESRAGAITVRVRHDDSQRRDVALVPKGGHLRAGRCANTLVRARLTDLGEGGALYDERVRLRPLDASQQGA